MIRKQKRTHLIPVLFPTSKAVGGGIIRWIICSGLAPSPRHTTVGTRCLSAFCPHHLEGFSIFFLPLLSAHIIQKISFYCFFFSFLPSSFRRLIYIFSSSPFCYNHSEDLFYFIVSSSLFCPHYSEDLIKLFLPLLSALIINKISLYCFFLSFLPSSFIRFLYIVSSSLVLPLHS